MSLVDTLILLAFMVYAVSSGFAARKKASRNLEEYFLAGRSQPGWKAGISMAATQFAADTPLLVTGIIAVSGIFFLWQLWIYALAFLMMGFVLGRCWSRAGVVTDAELAEVRYGAGPAALLRGIKALYFGTLFNCVVLAWVLFAGAKICEPFLLWNQWLPGWLYDPVWRFVERIGIPLTDRPAQAPDFWIYSANNFISVAGIVAVTWLYSATGGLRSVMATDVVQFAIMITATAVFCLIVVARVGGLGALPVRLAEMFAGGGPGGLLPEQLLAFTPDRARNATYAFLFLLTFQWLIQLNADGTGYLAQRFMSCRTEKDGKIAVLVFTFSQVVVRSLLWLPLGLGLLLLFPPDPNLGPDFLRAEREASYVRGMAELMPAGLRGLMLTAMLAALASTVDTHLNWGASYWTNDLFKRFICQAWLRKTPSDRSLVRAARMANALIILLAFLIMPHLTSLNTAWQLSLLLGAGMGAVLVLRWLWWRMTARAEIAAVLTSLVAAPLFFFSLESQALRLLLVAAVSTAAALAAIYAFGPEDPETLKAFFLRVHPPGFWGPVARAVSASGYRGPRDLARSCLAVFFSGVTVFSVLTGTGSWLVGSPAPVWFPWPKFWPFALMALGLAAFPVWIRLGFFGKASAASSPNAEAG